MDQRDDAPLADESTGAIPNDMPDGGEAPSGLPEGGGEPDPAGATESSPEGEGEKQRGSDAMPGIPDEDEPYSGG